jgi:crossover junction endodeoxyribonuclease RusA
MTVPADITLLLPEPPSTNRIWRNVVMGGKPRTLKSKEYRDWLFRAGISVANQTPCDQFAGAYSMRITVPKQRRDLGNNEKPISDLLQEAGVIKDDSQAQAIHIVRDPAREPGHLLVEIWAV